MADFCDSTEAMTKYMSQAGAAGYTGVLYLYHHSTTQVIVRWTYSTLSQRSKEDTEQCLLELMSGDLGDPHAQDLLGESLMCEIDEISSIDLSSHLTKSSDLSAGDVGMPVIAERRTVAPVGPVLRESNVREFAAEDFMVLNIKVEPEGETKSPAAGDLTINNRDNSKDAEMKKMLEESVSGPHDLFAQQQMPAKENPLECTICNKVFYDVSTRVRHVKTTHTSEKPYQCLICHKSFTRRDYLVTHHRSHTGERPYNCKVCKRSFTTRSKLSTHLKTQPGGECRVGPPVNNSYPSRSKGPKVGPVRQFDWETLTGSTFGPSKYSSIHGDKLSLTILTDLVPESESGDRLPQGHSLLQGHALSQGRIQERRSEDGCHLRTRPVLAIGGNDTTCPVQNSHMGSVGDFMFASSHGNEGRPRTHSQDIPPQSKKSSKYKTVLPFQLRSHIAEKSFKCAVCYKTFSSNIGLSTHQLIHTGGNPLQCGVCSKTFYDSPTRARHERTTHIRDKPYQCPVCHKSFPRRDYLIVHYRSHTGEKPYICAFCKKAFVSGSNLSAHLKTHSNEITGVKNMHAKILSAPS